VTEQERKDKENNKGMKKEQKQRATVEISRENRKTLQGKWSG